MPRTHSRPSALAQPRPEELCALLGDVRMATDAVQSLTALGEQALPHLREALRNKEPAVVRRAAVAVVRMSDGILTGELPAIIDAAARVELPREVHTRVAACGAKGIFALCAQVRRSGVVAVAELLAHFGEGALPLLPEVIAAFDDPKNEGYERWHLSHIVGRMGAGAKAAIPMVVREVGSPFEVVRWAALDALWQLGAGTQAVDGAVRALSGTPSLREVVAALRVVAQAAVVREDVVAAVRRHLPSRDREVLELVWSTLAQLGPEAALPSIREALASNSPGHLKSGPLLAARLLGPGARPLHDDVAALVGDRTWSYFAKLALSAMR